MKESYYFSHDYSARSDYKIRRLIARHGAAGYGIFWALIEDLYQNENQLPLDFESLAYELRTDENVIKSIINDFDLFKVRKNTFSSDSVKRRLDVRGEKTKKAKDAASKRWSGKRVDANAMQTHTESNAIKERKGKEILKKEKNIGESDFFEISSSIQKTHPEMSGQDCEIEALKFVSYFRERDWKYKDGSEITNLGAAAANWEVKINKPQIQTQYQKNGNGKRNISLADAIAEAIK